VVDVGKKLLRLQKILVSEPNSMDEENGLREILKKVISEVFELDGDEPDFGNESMQNFSIFKTEFRQRK
jgi:hypothetical protein